MYPNTQILLDERWCSWRKLCSLEALQPTGGSHQQLWSFFIHFFPPSCCRVFTHQINWDLSPSSDITFAENKKVTSGYVMQFSDVGLSPPICNFPNRTLRHCYSYTQVQTKGEFCQRSYGRLRGKKPQDSQISEAFPQITEPQFYPLWKWILCELAKFSRNSLHWLVFFTFVLCDHLARTQHMEF